MTANDTAAASYQLRRKEREADIALMRGALEALEEPGKHGCGSESRLHASSNLWSCTNQWCKKRVAAIDALNERLLRE